MKDNIFTTVRSIISTYIEISDHELDMNADLDLVYDIDSTEMTELAKEIEREFGISASKSERSSWESGQSIYEFILASQAGSNTRT